jgi:predicted O-methyltransferase YrrM
MNHFWRSIEGFFTFPDFYSWLAKEAAEKSWVRGVEIGAYCGQSAAYLAVELKNLGSTCNIDLVDIFDPRNRNSVEAVKANLEPVSATIGTLRQECSWEAARYYPDSSLDFVFIDASHFYEDVKRDIAAWRTKVRPGGILAGHDFCADSVMNFGVVEAVTEAFEHWEVWRGRNDGGDARMQGKYFPVWCVRM